MLQELEDKIGYHFKDKKYLKTPLTHSSYANENKKAAANSLRHGFAVPAPSGREPWPNGKL